MSDMIAFDIDGTLIDPQTHEIPGSTLDALEEMHAAGFLLVISTGRGMRESSLRDLLPYKNWDGYVCNNGLSVYDHACRRLHAAHFPKEIVLQCIETADRCGVNLAFQGEQFSYLLREPTPEVREAHAFFHTPVPPVCPPFSQEFFGMLAYAPLGYDYAPFREVRGVTVHNSVSSYADLIPAGFTKGTGLQLLKGHLGAERCICFGDSMNDYDMFRFADISIAMGQADQRLKAIADHVTRPVWDNGIAHAWRTEADFF